jgi:hypothetical protein
MVILVRALCRRSTVAATAKINERKRIGRDGGREGRVGRLFRFKALLDSDGSKQIQNIPCCNQPQANRALRRQILEARKSIYEKRILRERICIEDVDPMYTSRGESLLLDLVQGS